jgi:hypothetical protein
MKCSSVTTSLHAFKRMINRKISPEEIRDVVEHGEIIKTYPDDKPYPSLLLFKIVNKRPLHVVVGKNETNSECIIVTVYIAGDEFWQPDYKTKK